MSLHAFRARRLFGYAFLTCTASPSQKTHRGKPSTSLEARVLDIGHSYRCAGGDSGCQGGALEEVIDTLFSGLAVGRVPTPTFIVPLLASVLVSRLMWRMRCGAVRQMMNVKVRMRRVVWWKVFYSWLSHSVEYSCRCCTLYLNIYINISFRCPLYSN